MNTRAALVLAIAIVVLAALAFFGGRDAAETGVSQGDKLMPELESRINDIESVAILGPGDTAIATLERGAETWTVAEKHGYAADVGRLRQSLFALAEAEIVERKTANPELYDRLGVEDLSAATASGIAVELTGGEGEWPRIILGEPEGDSLRYARRGDAATSFLIDRDPELPRSAVQWLDTRIVAVPGNRIESVTIEHPGGASLLLSKANPEATDFAVEDVPEGRELLYAGVANVVGNALRDLVFEDVEPLMANEPPPESIIEVEYRTFDGLVIEIDGVERDEEAWISLVARVAGEASAEAADAEQAAEPAAPRAAAEPNAPAANAAEAAGAGVAAEAAEINERVAGWRYRIPSYQFDQITRRMSDLLQPPGE